MSVMRSAPGKPISSRISLKIRGFLTANFPAMTDLTSGWRLARSSSSCGASSAALFVHRLRVAARTCFTVSGPAVRFQNTALLTRSLVKAWSLKGWVSFLASVTNSSGLHGMPTLTVWVALPAGTSAPPPVSNMCRSMIFVPAGKITPSTVTSAVSLAPLSGRCSMMSAVACSTNTFWPLGRLAGLAAAAAAVKIRAGAAGGPCRAAASRTISATRLQKRTGYSASSADAKPAKVPAANFTPQGLCWCRPSHWRASLDRAGRLVLSRCHLSRSPPCMQAW
eukprot:14397352-Heterocapsa_arctica.AAC.1